eukprot:6857947-Alexandrium_andersonii.AAC.1
MCPNSFLAPQLLSQSQASRRQRCLVSPVPSSGEARGGQAVLESGIPDMLRVRCCRADLDSKCPAEARSE